MRIHQEGISSLLWALAAWLLLSGAAWFFLPALFLPVAIVSLLPLVFFLQFFRNPVREISQKDNALVYAPADGRIVVVEETEESEYFHDRRIQVSIFMSPINVHVNRNPVGGKILYSRYHPGKYLVASLPKSSQENERTTLVYDTGGHRVLMRQIAGAVARRIVCYLKEGDEVRQGEEMGFIKLGSRVDLFLPLGTELMVGVGDTARGNETLIGRLP